MYKSVLLLLLGRPSVTSCSKRWPLAFHTNQCNKYVSAVKHTTPFLYKSADWRTITCQITTTTLIFLLWSVNPLWCLRTELLVQRSRANIKPLKHKLRAKPCRLVHCFLTSITWWSLVKFEHELSDTGSSPWCHTKKIGVRQTKTSPSTCQELNRV